MVVCDDADLKLEAEHAVASLHRRGPGARPAAGRDFDAVRRVRDAMLKRAAAVKFGSGPDDECGSGDFEREPQPPARAVGRRRARAECSQEGTCRNAEPGY